MKLPPVYDYSKFLLRYFFTKAAANKKPWIFSRTACLGNDALMLSGESKSRIIINVQKGRADLLSRTFFSNSSNSFWRTYRIISRKDILHLVWQQSQGSYRKMPPPDFVLFDSFSDLTDRCFLLSNGKSIYCHRSDLVPLRKNTLLVDNGLLELQNIERTYREIFANFQEVWGDIKIIFVHFPVELESRPNYVSRARAIEHAIKNLSQINRLIYSIHVPSLLVEPEIDSDGKSSTFAYHYSQTTKEYVSKEISRVLNGAS
jgi:hypothetical protein